MPKFRVNWSRDEGGAPAPALRVDAENWMGALARVLRQIGLDDEAQGGVVCDVALDGTIHVHEPRSGLRLELADIQDLEITEEDEEDPTTDAALPGVDAARPPSPAEDDAADEAMLEAMLEECLALDEALCVTGACDAALDILLRHIAAESASVLLLRPHSSELEFVATRGPSAPQLRGTRIPATAGIAAVVLESGRSMLVRHADTHPSHYGEVDRRSGYHTRAMIAAPVRGPRGALGVVEILNPPADQGFREAHQDGVALVAGRLGARVNR